MNTYTGPVAVVGEVEQLARRLRPQTFLEQQPFIVTHGICLTLVSPLACCYQVCKLNPQAAVPFKSMVRLSAAIFPSQILLRTLQTNICTPIKENLNPWLAFGAVGVLQGAVYGHANVYFARQLAITRVAQVVSLRAVMRGWGFAFARDMISQGIPFMCAPLVRQHVIDKVWTTDESSSPAMVTAKHWSSVISTSIVTTYLSQGIHNCQTSMQVDQTLGYVAAIKSVWQKNGIASLYRGAEARVGLLLIVNILNELLLKRAWRGVEVEVEE